MRAREIEVSVLGNDAPQASLPGEIIYEGEWYDYATKYAEGQARLLCPAPLTPELTTRFRELAPQLQALPALTFEGFQSGVALFTLGLAKKLAIAVVVPVAALTLNART